MRKYYANANMLLRKFSYCSHSLWYNLISTLNNTSTATINKKQNY